MKYRVYNFSGINTRISPMLQQAGELTRCVNIDSYPYGGKRKRQGYETYLGTANGSAVQDLFNWTDTDGTTMYNYRYSGGILYNSAQGTAEWSICGNGTFTGDHVGGAVLGDTLIVGDGAGSTRHTTDGTSFTNTTLAPPSQFFTQYQQRIYAAGTASTLFYSTTGDATNWQTTGTSDSSSLDIPGAGKLNGCFVANNRVVAPKNSGRVFRWDGYELYNIPTNRGPDSPYSLSEVEDFWFYINRNGVYTYSGDKPQLLSTQIERQIYNDADTGIVGTVFSTAPGKAHRYGYYTSVGDTTDDFTGQTISNCVMRYDFLLNEWSNYSFYNKPTAFLSYKDPDGVQKFVLGDGDGQCYTLGGNTDNGQPIEAVMEGVLNFGNPDMDKKFDFIRISTNPGCCARMQVAYTDTFTKAAHKWHDVGDLQSGFKKFDFPENSRGKLLYYRIIDSSVNDRFIFYGFTIDYEEIGF